MNNKDSDSAWTKSWCCTHGYHDECGGCPRCKYVGHEKGSKHMDVMGGHGGQGGERLEKTWRRPVAVATTQKRPNPVLHVDQVWNPYDNRWERL